MLSELKDTWQKFRRSKAESAALVLKLDSDNQTIISDGDIRTVSPEDLADDLSDSNPRWIIWSLKIDREDGRVQYPLIPVYFSPESCNERSKMLYSSKTQTVAQDFELGKVHIIHDLDDMSQESLQRLHLSTVTR